MRRETWGKFPEIDGEAFAHGTDKRANKPCIRMAGSGNQLVLISISKSVLRLLSIACVFSLLLSYDFGTSWKVRSNSQSINHQEKFPRRQTKFFFSRNLACGIDILIIKTAVNQNKRTRKPERNRKNQSSSCSTTHSVMMLKRSRVHRESRAPVLGPATLIFGQSETDLNKKHKSETERTSPLRARPYSVLILRPSPVRRWKRASVCWPAILLLIIHSMDQLMSFKLEIIRGRCLATHNSHNLTLHRCLHRACGRANYQYHYDRPVNPRL